ncbi:hypothetical protein EVAR_33879_1 [Eumeta japonica]|uniref:Uncharacterized protein n=1 Tax=Eumeta variegata TaxID=151549 RepID=A0A4C1WI98_EUMVA|nr:hypothetical protein EVAR_33879_1 [Eumeta japonica]
MSSSGIISLESNRSHERDRGYAPKAGRHGVTGYSVHAIDGRVLSTSTRAELRAKASRVELVKFEVDRYLPTFLRGKHIDRTYILMSRKNDASAIARRAQAAHGTFPERGPETNSLPYMVRNAGRRSEGSYDGSAANSKALAPTYMRHGAGGDPARQSQSSRV